MLHKSPPPPPTQGIAKSSKVEEDDLKEGRAASSALMEGTGANRVRPSCAELNGQHNPFFGYPRGALAHTQVGPQHHKLFPVKAPHEPSSPPGGSTMSRSDANSTPGGAVSPIVISPYIINMNEELEGNFELINNQVPALPCEVQQLECKLGPLKSAWKKTIILDLDETLISAGDFRQSENDRDREREGEGEKVQVTKSHTSNHITLQSEDGTTTDIEFIKRPRLEEFLQTLSRYYEIIVLSLPHS